VSNKKPRPEDGAIEKKRHIADEKFTKLVRWEVFPLLLIAGCAFAYTQFKPQIQNTLLSGGRFQALSKYDLREVSRKISGFLKHTYQ